MSRYAAVVVAVLALCASAGAVELASAVPVVQYGFDLGTQTSAGWYEDYYGYPVSIRGGAFDLLADVPLSKVSSINFRAGTFGSTTRGKADDGSIPLEDMIALDGRVAYFASLPLVKDMVDVYAGVGATGSWLHYWNATQPAEHYQKVSQTGIAVGVPAGFKFRLWKHVVVGMEFEVPDYGVYHDAIVDGAGEKTTLSWWQYGSQTPSFCGALYLVH
jgi:hypothetical protein